MLRWVLPGFAVRLCRVFCLISLLVAPAFSPAQSGNGKPTLAPPNPAFVEYMNSHSTQGRQLRQMETTQTPGAHATGQLPGPMDFSHLAEQQHLSREAGVTIPSSYDLRTANGVNRVTAVRNQGSCGACWTFASYGALESELMPGETRDFSENNLKNLHGFDWGPCFGGNGQMSSAYLARWGGPINEADDPYQANTNPTSPAGLSPQKHIQDINVYPFRSTSTDNDALKTAVMTYGALHTSIYVDDDASADTTGTYYNASNKAFYYNGTAKTNHAVTLVGWDDNYSKSNFSTTPAGNGAFLIKNSWGSAWGNQGYFWVSYYDTRFAMTEESYAFVGSESTANYARKYEYDPLGQVNAYGYGSNTAWFANVFTAAASEPLTAVSFWANANNTTYLIKIYTNVTGGIPTAGTLALSTSGTIAVAGYHTIKLPSSVALTSGQKFSVVVQETTPGYNFPIPLQYAIAGYSSKATASAGQGFVSSDGSDWDDATTLGSSYPSASVCLKAFAGSGYVLTVNSTNPASGVALGVSPADVNGSGTASTSFTRVYSPGTQVTLTAPATVTGAYFSGWTGCSQASELTCTVTMSTNTTVTAAFVSSSGSVTPTITGMTPASRIAGAGAFTLTVNGNGFVDGAGVIWNGSDRTSTTTWVNSTQLTLPLTAADLAAAGLIDVAVKNPSNVGGAVSAAAKFAIDSSGSGSVTVSTTSTTVTLKPGSNASIPVTFAGTNAGVQITAACYNLPVGATCSYANGAVSFSTDATTPAGTYSLIVVFTVRQTQTASLHRRAPVFALWTPLATLPFGLLWVGAWRRKVLPWIALLALLLMLVACGGGGSSIGSSQNSTQATQQASLPVTMTVSQ